MRLSLFCQIVSLGFLCQVCAGGQSLPEHQGVVKLQVTDSCGRTLDGWRVDSFRNRRGKEMKDVFRGAVSRAIPFGVYFIRIQDSTYAYLPYEGTVTVRSPETLLAAGVKSGGIDGTPPSFDIRGRFEVAPASGAWCKISGLYTNDAYFSAVATDGSFLFPYVPVATYTLICRHDSDTIALRAVQACGGQHPEIVIPSPSASTKGADGSVSRTR